MPVNPCGAYRNDTITTKSTRDLLWTPVQGELLTHKRPHRFSHLPWTQRCLPPPPAGQAGSLLIPVAPTSAVAMQLPADRRWRASQLSRNLAQRINSLPQCVNLAPFLIGKMMIARRHLIPSNDVLTERTGIISLTCNQRDEYALASALSSKSSVALRC